MRVRAAAAIVVALAVVGCAGEETTEARALDYLASTDDELGVDVLVAVREYGRLSGDPRAEAVVAARLDGVRPGELERYGVLLDTGLATFPAERLEPTAVSGTPDPEAMLGDDRDGTCPLEALVCALSEPCIEYLALDAWGYVLTHQALTLVFARAAECSLPIDVDARRRELASRLIAEMRADPRPLDLAFERLAMLGALGYPSAIERGWIHALRAAQQPEGCFAVSDAVRCHPHPTGLALWVLGFASE